MIVKILSEELPVSCSEKEISVTSQEYMCENG